ncbi:MAG: BACON domain-containing protein [Planctomycetota bacterium]|jgi:hypothetical protein
MDNENSSPTVTGCTFYGNSAASGGGIDSVGTSNPVLVNCILWGNIASAAPEVYGICSVSHSDVAGGHAGTGNIDADPCFVNAAGGDFHLLEGSPCVEAGDPAYIAAPGETDIDGEPRITGLRVDMGVDEFPMDKPMIETWPAEFEFSAGLGGPNPAPQVLHIRNIGANTLNWEIAEDCSWLSAEPNSGTSTGETDDTTLSVDIAGLVGGQYYCELVVSDPCALKSPQMVNVSLVVSAPIIELSSQVFEFQADESGPNPASQTLTVRNSGAGTLNWEISYDCNWLSAEPDRGSSTGEVDEVTLSVDIAGLAAGQYNCDLLVSDENAANSPEMVRVTVYISSWLHVPLEYATIQAGIDAAGHGDMVIIAPGTYTGNGNRDIDFRGKAITVRSTDPDNPSVVAATVIDCNGSVEDPHGGFSFHSGEGPNSVLAGLTITNGYAIESGGGVFSEGSSPRITRCIIAGNLAEASGGGIAYIGGNPVISRCTIVANSSDAGSAGIYFEASSATVKNCLIANNEGSMGGGICCRMGSALTVSHCTITDNVAPGLGGGILVDYDSAAMISHSILWGNIATNPDGWQIVVSSSSNVTVCFSDVEGGPEDIDVFPGCTLTWGEGNIDADPCFVDAAGSDYHLSQGSACIDAGDPNYSSGPGETDIDGEARVRGGRVDIGADEFSGGPLLRVWPGAFEFYSYAGGFNPEDQVLSIQNGGAGVLNWQITEDCEWLEATPTSGASSGEVNQVSISVDVAGLSWGQYSCGLTIWDPCATNSPQVVDVSLVMGGAIIEVSSQGFEFSATEGGANPEGQLLTIGNSGPATLNWRITEGCGWLSAEPNSGSSTGEPESVTVSVDISGLGAGSYYCELMISDPNAENSPQVVDVNLVIIGPVIELSSHEFSFGAEPNGPNPADQILTVRNSGGGTLNWQISYDCNWLSAEPSSGSSTGEPDSVTLGVDISGLGSGTYDCELTVWDANAENSPQVVSVDFLVSGPLIELSSQEFEFEADEGGPNPAPQILTISNSGLGTLIWQISEDCGWLSAEPNSGSSTGEVNQVSLSVDVSGLVGGVYNCELEASANALNSPQTIDVALSLRASSGQLSVPSAYPTIQSAIDAAEPGDTVVVAPGVYTGAGNKNLDFGGKAITVGSTDPEDPNVVGATVIDCEGSGRGFYFHNGEDTNSVVDGLTITGGYADGGGGIYMHNSSPTIRRCVIKANRGSAGANGTYEPGSDGGGVYCSSSSAVFSECEIVGNRSGEGGIVGGGDGGGGSGHGGGLYCVSSSLTIIDCLISGNRTPDGIGGDLYTEGYGGHGGGIYCKGSSLVIVNSRITGNTTGRVPGGTYCSGEAGDGGGIYCINGSSVTVTDCIISNNRTGSGSGEKWMARDGGDGGGIYCESSALTINNSIMKANVTGAGGESWFGAGGDGGDGGAVFAWDFSARIRNCTVTQNATGSGGTGNPNGSYGLGAGAFAEFLVQIADTIVWGNVPDQIDGAAEVMYSDIGGGWPGIGNIDADPCFVSGPLGDYYLSQVAAGQAVDSPCVDAGSDTAANLGLDDFTTRTDQFRDKGVVDMGYHYGISSGSPDMDENLHVELLDYALLAADWLKCSEVGYLGGDITKDECVDVNDLKALLDSWLECYVGLPSGPSAVENRSGADGDVSLSWSAGEGALYHDVYLGTDVNGVADAGHASAEFMGTVSNANFEVAGLEAGAWYYWRVDSVGPRCTAQGRIWSFRTRDPNLDPNHMGWWKFDEGTGNIAYDSAGGKHGTVYGAVWTSRQIGGALWFDGADDYVGLPGNEPVWLPENDFALSVWVYFDRSAGFSSNELILDLNYGASGDPDYELGYCLLRLQGTGALWFLMTTTTNSDEDLNTGYVLGSGQWHHIVAVRDGTTQAVYVGGQFTDGRTCSPDPIDFVGGYDDDKVNIGRNTKVGNPGNCYLQGTIDDVRIYKRALTAEEIEQLYQGGL